MDERHFRAAVQGYNDWHIHRLSYHCNTLTQSATEAHGSVLYLAMNVWTTFGFSTSTFDDSFLKISCDFHSFLDVLFAFLQAIKMYS